MLQACQNFGFLNQVDLISSTSLLLTLFFFMEAVRVYLDFYTVFLHFGLVFVKA